MGYLDNLDVVDLEQVIDNGLGTKPNDNIPLLREQLNLNPVFGFNYLACEGSEFCFNNPEIPASDFVSMLMKMKALENLSFEDLTKTFAMDEYRFHSIDHKKLEVAGLVARFNKQIGANKRSLPEIFQFQLYTDHKTKKAPRVVGFVGRWGIFYVLWFDFSHLIYPKKN